MERAYELAVVLHPDAEVDLKASAAKIETLLKSSGGEVVEHEDWGKRKLAYEIKKQQYGIYLIYQVKMPPAKVGSFEHELSLNSEILRYLIVKAAAIKPPKLKTKPLIKAKTVSSPKAIKTTVKGKV